MRSTMTRISRRNWMTARRGEEPEDAPKKVLAPVLTQERPAGAWQPDLNLPAQPVSSGTTNVPAALQQPENIPAAVQPGIQVAKATTEAPSGGRARRRIRHIHL